MSKKQKRPQRLDPKTTSAGLSGRRATQLTARDVEAARPVNRFKRVTKGIARALLGKGA